MAENHSLSHEVAVRGIELLTRERSVRASGDLGKEEHLAVGTDRLEQRVLVDLAVGGHGDAVLEMTFQRRVQLGELLEQLLHGRRREEGSPVTRPTCLIAGLTQHKLST